MRRRNLSIRGIDRADCGGFMLLEIILAVFLLTGGLLALGRCMTNCLASQAIIGQEQRARQALENAMVQIQASTVLPDETNTTKLEGMFTGLTLVERRHTLDIRNEKNINLPDLHEITLTVSWRSADGSAHARSVAFDLLRGSG